MTTIIGGQALEDALREAQKNIDAGEWPKPEPPLKSDTPAEPVDNEEPTG